MVSDIEAVAAKQNVTFRPWDILVVRMGFMSEFNSSSVEERNQLAAAEKDLALFVQCSTD
jgi:hypothetical protein